MQLRDFLKKESQKAKTKRIKNKKKNSIELPLKNLYKKKRN